MKLTTKLIISIIIISLFSLYVFEIKYNMLLFNDLKEIEEKYLQNKKYLLKLYIDNKGVKLLWRLKRLSKE